MHPASRNAPNRQIAVFTSPILLFSMRRHRASRQTNLVDALMEVFADLEMESLLSRYVNRLPCHWITALALPSVFDLETPKSPNLDAIPLSQRICHSVESDEIDACETYARKYTRSMAVPGRGGSRGCRSGTLHAEDTGVTSRNSSPS